MRMRFSDVLRVTGAEKVSGDPDLWLGGLSTDTRSLKQGELYLALRGPNFDGDAFAAQALAGGAGGVFLSSVPDTPWPAGLAVARHPEPRKALGQIARFMRNQFSGPVIGITGSCGKTSTKEILLQLLGEVHDSYGSPASFNNDVGVPLTILGAPQTAQSWVVEMGTNGPGEIENLCQIAAPTGAILTNIGESHLAGLKSAEGVAQEKGALLRSLPATGFCVLNGDCAYSQELAHTTQARVIRFSLSGPAEVMAQDLYFEAGATRLTLVAPGLDGPVSLRMPLLGSHMVQNLVAALACVVGLGIDLNEVLPRVARLRGAGGRMTRIEVDGMTVVDDSYNANPFSVAAGIRQLCAMPAANERVLVVGDMLELGDHTEARHREVGRLAATKGVDRLLCVGEYADHIAHGAVKAGMDRGSVYTFDDCAELIATAPGCMAPGDVVLIKASRALGLERLVDALLVKHPVI